MSAPLRKIALLGASGHLGTHLLAALEADPSFDITVITRASSTFEFPIDVKVVRVSDDYPQQELVRAFKGHDAVILALNTGAEKYHNVMVDACIKAGVRRLIPSVFGGRHTPAVQSVFPVAKAKADILSYVEACAAQQGEWTYTALSTGPFHELCVGAGMYDIDAGSKTATLWDGGDARFSVSTYGTIAQAVLQILRMPGVTKNETVYVSSFETSQKELLGIYQDGTGGAEGWTVEYEDCEEGIKEAQDMYCTAEDGMTRMKAVGRLALLSTVMKGAGGDFEAEGLSWNGRLGLEGEDVVIVTRMVLGIMVQQELTEQQLAFIADRGRVWQVRRFCQVLPSVVEYERGDETAHGTYSGSEPNGALAALLRCVIYRLGADLAMVSLLDDHNQYFVSGASRHNIQDVKLTLDSTRWYGCESVAHHGGLCERTITQQDYPGNMAFYEELDMAHTERTQNLPFVKGDIANFRHYAGVPLNPYGGPNIGTVFFFSEKPSETSLSVGIRSYLAETATHITRHLEQAVEALEGKRALRFNRGVASLLTISSAHPNSGSQGSFLDTQCGRQHLVSNLYTDGALYVYNLAATLLCDIFEFDGVRIQEVGVARNIVNIDANWNGSKIIAQHLQPIAQKPGDLPEALVERLLELFPQGAVFHIAAESSEVIAATVVQDAAVLVNDVVFTELSKAFPNVEQMILMPLWEAHHERTVGAVLGFANRQSNVYLSTTDLSSMSAFCTTTMTQVRRLEVQAIDQIKSDFLGSVSHEMRTPLHGILSSLELLADTPYNEYQRDLLKMAQYSGSSLLETIDRVLYFSGVSSEVQLPAERSVKRSSGWLSQQQRIPPYQTAASPPEEETSGTIHICESYLRHAAHRLHLKRTVRPELFRPRRSVGSLESSSALLTESRSVPPHPVILFDTNATWTCRFTAVASFKTVYTNLLDNALKFGDPAGCVCVHLDIGEGLARLSFTDTGKGVASDFIRHVMLDPFSQEDPLNEGTGLGLANVKHAVAELGGRMLIDSNESWGSTFTVTFPSDRIAYDPSQETSDFTTTDFHFTAPELPKLDMSFSMPRRWETGDNVRDRRCADMVLDSLMRGVSRWFQTKATLWKPPSALPHLLFILLEDLDHALQTCGDAVNRAQVIVLCPDIEKTLSLQKTSLQNATAIVGPVTVSSLQNALARLFPGTVPPSETHASLDQTSRILKDGKNQAKTNGVTAWSTSTGVDDLLPRMLSNFQLRREDPESDGHASAQQRVISKAEPLAVPDEASSEASKTLQSDNIASTSQTQLVVSKRDKHTGSISRALPEPKMLLVDDNSINLKVLVMLAHKCSAIPSTSVGGGQEAIDAIEEALKNDCSTRQTYDLVFLDLSMPEISGFDVAKKIREMEACSKESPRTYICALTGLASANDRNKAFAAGVDGYLVKPAKLKDLQAVIGQWRDSLADQQQYG
ncbi:uncharacterized protein N0V89_008949 [Didymosphaeria variabile]|uniref:Uncharacterized protein n=1 Tax=Didymosphaeria variabile TaxID=1932322 RepID=A0A9W8XH76_9PLEO|nr:uncharacterized protein N0V89_008949 [Didymosphaeria variabile]KAJ4350328.1 hypothetical protein N0V89_008949 [Didymosphaeria variabile]